LDSDAMRMPKIYFSLILAMHQICVSITWLVSAKSTCRQTPLTTDQTRLHLFGQNVLLYVAFKPMQAAVPSFWFQNNEAPTIITESMIASKNFR
jgi:hypothetical protein